MECVCEWPVWLLDSRDEQGRPSTRRCSECEATESWSPPGVAIGISEDCEGCGGGLVLYTLARQPDDENPSQWDFVAYDHDPVVCADCGLVHHISINDYYGNDAMAEVVGPW